MKGYIVGYNESWANDVKNVIRGYFTTWSRAVNLVREIEYYNKTLHKGSRSVYLVEVDVNRVYPEPKLPFWYQSFHYYTIQYEVDKMLLVPVKGGKPVELQPYKK